jgi:FAD/FMN-containing dehydrogenase
MKVVLANGDVIKVGGRVVKNVAGYDLCKLFTGSFGTLGIVAEVNFKLRPTAKREATVVATGRPTDLIAGGQAILEARLFPVATELVSSGFASRLGITTDPDSAVLLVRFAGNDKGVKYQTRSALSELSGNARVRETDTISGDAEIWQTLAAVPLQEPSLFGWRASVLPDRLDSFVSTVSEIYGGFFDSMVWQVGAGCGRMRMLDSSERNAEETATLIEQLRIATRSARGALTFEGMDAETEGDSSSKPALELAVRIKQQLDPQGLFGVRCLGTALA